jgi:hypothetical protein
MTRRHIGLLVILALAMLWAPCAATGWAGPKAPSLAVRDGERADVRGWWTRVSAPSAARSRSRAWPGKRRMSTTRSRRTSRPGRPEPHEAQTFGQVDAERRLPMPRDTPQPCACPV